MQLKAFYFAALRDLVGLDEELVELDGESCNMPALIAVLEARHPRLSMVGVRVAVNEEFVEADVTLKHGDVVALIPPVSGG